jgi:hypothetical protein
MDGNEPIGAAPTELGELRPSAEMLRVLAAAHALPLSLPQPQPHTWLSPGAGHMCAVLVLPNHRMVRPPMCLPPCTRLSPPSFPRAPHAQQLSWRAAGAHSLPSTRLLKSHAACCHTHLVVLRHLRRRRCSSACTRRRRHLELPSTARLGSSSSGTHRLPPAEQLLTVGQVSVGSEAALLGLTRRGPHSNTPYSALRTHSPVLAFLECTDECAVRDGVGCWAARPLAASGPSLAPHAATARPARTP